MDCEVFLCTRVRKAYVHGGSPDMPTIQTMGVGLASAVPFGAHDGRRG